VADTTVDSARLGAAEDCPPAWTSPPRSGRVVATEVVPMVMPCRARRRPGGRGWGTDSGDALGVGRSGATCPRRSKPGVRIALSVLQVHWAAHPRWAGWSGQDAV